MIKSSKTLMKKDVWKAKVITLLPESFPGILDKSLTGKALKDGLWELEVIDLREFGEGKHRNVDDKPYGGGPGMVLRADIVGKAIKKTCLLYTSPSPRD